MERDFITCCAESDDAEMFARIWNIGIDSRLEAFTRSRAEYRGGRLCLDMDEAELSILMRRLAEDDSETADQWERDILYVHYGIETV